MRHHQDRYEAVSSLCTVQFFNAEDIFFTAALTTMGIITSTCHITMYNDTFSMLYLTNASDMNNLIDYQFFTGLQVSTTSDCVLTGVVPPSTT